MYIHTDEQNIGDDAVVDADADADVLRWCGGSFVLFCAVCVSLIVGVAGCGAGSPLRHMCGYNYSKYMYICMYIYVHTCIMFVCEPLRYVHARSAPSLEPAHCEHSFEFHFSIDFSPKGLRVILYIFFITIRRD